MPKDTHEIAKLVRERLAAVIQKLQDTKDRQGLLCSPWDEYPFHEHLSLAPT